VQWLYDELPRLVQAGVVSADTADRLRQYYGPVTTRQRRSLALIICSILGALLIGSGIILLVAHNWQTFSRPTRTVLSFLPLILGQLVSAWTLLYRRQSVPWREGAAVFLIMGLGAALALVSQTYHIPGNLASFLLVWSLLSLPLAYLMAASLPAALVLIGLTGWAAYARQYGHVLRFWPLVALLMPYVWLTVREQPYGLRAMVLGWPLCLCLCIGLGLTLSYTIPGLWLVAYASLFTVFYLLDKDWSHAATSLWQRPLHVIGLGGIVGLSMLLTYDGTWKALGNWSRYGRSDVFERWLDQGFTLALFGLALGLLVLALRRQQLTDLLFGAAAGLMGLAYGAALAGVPHAVLALLFNAYVLLLGLNALRLGLQHQQLSTMNGGLLLVSALIVVRFLDARLSFTIRGLAFIVLGVAFLVANIVMRRREAT
jgi:uncharacterized membrane protein